jgi:hypothetical protein
MERCYRGKGSMIEGKVEDLGVGSIVDNWVRFGRERMFAAWLGGRVVVAV